MFDFVKEMTDVTICDDKSLSDVLQEIIAHYVVEFLTFFLKTYLQTFLSFVYIRKFLLPNWTHTHLQVLFLWCLKLLLAFGIETLPRAQANGIDVPAGGLVTIFSLFAIGT